MSESAQPGHLEHKSRVWDEGHGPHSPGLSHLFQAIGVHHALPEGTNTEAHSTALLDEGHLPNSSATALPKIKNKCTQVRHETTFIIKCPSNRHLSSTNMKFDHKSLKHIYYLVLCEIHFLHICKNLHICTDKRVLDVQYNFHTHRMCVRRSVKDSKKYYGLKN